MRVALAGLGGAAIRGHLPALIRLAAERRLAIVAGADPEPDRRAEIAHKLCGVPIFDSTQAMLASVRSDVLVVAAEPSAHAHLAVLGMQHGQHVVCEKPLTVSRDDHVAVADACIARPELALVPVHQYRYSPTWIAVRRWAEAAARLRIPFEFTVVVERDGADRHAAGPWRLDRTSSGGMLADHGSHFLALGWTIRPELDVVGATRTRAASRRECSRAYVRLGSGTLEITVSSPARSRRTAVRMRAGRFAFDWIDAHARVTVAGRAIGGWRTDALSDRRHVDSLYLPFYRDLAVKLRGDAWRVQRTAEAVAVGRALVVLLEKLEHGAVAA